MQGFGEEGQEIKTFWYGNYTKCIATGQLMESCYAPFSVWIFLACAEFISVHRKNSVVDFDHFNHHWLPKLFKWNLGYWPGCGSDSP